MLYFYRLINIDQQIYIGESMSVRRTRLDIIRDILELAEGGIRKTRLMYRLNLSFRAVNEYLSFLIQQGIITHTEKPRVYKLTKKGKQVLNNIKELQNILEISTFAEIPRKQKRM